MHIASEAWRPREVQERRGAGGEGAQLQEQRRGRLLLTLGVTRWQALNPPALLARVQSVGLKASLFHSPGTTGTTHHSNVFRSENTGDAVLHGVYSPLSPLPYGLQE